MGGGEMMDGWIWYGHKMHYICSDRCRWNMATELPNGYLVSSVGDMRPHDLEIGETWAEEDAEEIGMCRKYETMVFRIVGREECGCPVNEYTELDVDGYNTHIEASDGHMRMCIEWAEKS